MIDCYIFLLILVLLRAPCDPEGAFFLLVSIVAQEKDNLDKAGGLKKHGCLFSSWLSLCTLVFSRCLLVLSMSLCHFHPSINVHFKDHLTISPPAHQVKEAHIYLTGNFGRRLPSRGQQIPYNTFIPY